VEKKKVLVTGAIGFIGYHLCEKLIKEGYDVLGLDNINSYYDIRLKLAKLPILGITTTEVIDNKIYQSQKYSNFRFVKADIVDRPYIENSLNTEKFHIIVNLAAQAGVQYSIENPHTYIENNITGFINLLDAAKNNKVEHFVYASSSSVYGNRDDIPFKETDRVDNPISLYAASKKANELIAHTYSHLYGLKTTGLRFFTVYGPWGRPDMAPFIFTKNIIQKNPINVFNNGNMERDFTYVEDIINGIMLIINGHNKYSYKIYNIGNSSPVKLNDFIKTIEEAIGTKVKIHYRPMRVGDVIKTYADTSSLTNDYSYKPATSMEEGIRKFVDWYIKYDKKGAENKTVNEIKRH